MKPFDLVQISEECKKAYKNILPVDKQFVFLGEINQMPGHGVFAVVGSSVVYSGFHMDSFEIILR